MPGRGLAAEQGLVNGPWAPHKGCPRPAPSSVRSCLQSRGQRALGVRAGERLWQGREQSVPVVPGVSPPGQ